jgi:hypothetical protein
MINIYLNLSDLNYIILQILDIIENENIDNSLVSDTEVGNNIRYANNFEVIDNLKKGSNFKKYFNKVFNNKGFYISLILVIPMPFLLRNLSEFHYPLSLCLSAIHFLYLTTCFIVMNLKSES